MLQVAIKVNPRFSALYTPKDLLGTYATGLKSYVKHLVVTSSIQGCERPFELKQRSEPGGMELGAVMGEAKILTGSPSKDRDRISSGRCERGNPKMDNCLRDWNRVDTDRLQDL